MRIQDISACINLCFMAVPISYQQCLTFIIFLFSKQLPNRSTYNYEADYILVYFLFFDYFLCYFVKL